MTSWTISIIMIVVQSIIIIDSNAKVYSSGGTKTIYRGSDIRFPYEKKSFVPVTEPNCAKGATFCESVAEYPDSHVDLILEQNPKKYEDLFRKDIVMPDIILRGFYDFDEEQSLCSSIEKIIYPKVAEKYDNTWAYIINHRNHTQGVRVEECTHPNYQCEMTQSFPIGYYTKCKQKFIYRELLALDKFGNPEKSLFRVPSCCQCVLVRTGRRKRTINSTPTRVEN